MEYVDHDPPGKALASNQEEKAARLAAAAMEFYETGAFEYRAHLVLARLLGRVAAALEEPGYQLFHTINRSPRLETYSLYCEREQDTIYVWVGQDSFDLHAAKRNSRHTGGLLDQELYWLEGRTLSQMQRLFVWPNGGILWRPHEEPLPPTLELAKTAFLAYEERIRLTNAFPDFMGKRKRPTLGELLIPPRSPKRLPARIARVVERTETLYLSDSISPQVIPLSALRKGERGDISPRLLWYLRYEFPNWKPVDATWIPIPAKRRKLTYREIAELVNYNEESVGNALRKLERKAKSKRIS